MKPVLWSFQMYSDHQYTTAHILSRIYRKQKKKIRAGKNGPSISSMSGPAQHTKSPRVIIEIINNTRGGIESKIGERGVWWAYSSPGCSLIHDVPDKKGFFNFFKLFFVVKYWKYHFRLPKLSKTIEKVKFCPQNRQNDLKQRWGKHFIQISAVPKVVAKESISSTN